MKVSAGMIAAAPLKVAGDWANGVSFRAYGMLTGRMHVTFGATLADLVSNEAVVSFLPIPGKHLVIDEVGNDVWQVSIHHHSALTMVSNGDTERITKGRVILGIRSDHDWNWVTREGPSSAFLLRRDGQWQRVEGTSPSARILCGGN